MSESAPDISQTVNWRKVFLPVSIGMAISLYLLVTSFNPAALSAVHFTRRLLLGLILAALAIVVRDFAFMYKIRLSTGSKMSWLKTLQTIIMWEFGAAVTPKLGEVAFTLFVLKRSGLSYGRSVAVIMLNTFLDTLAFVVVFALLFISMGSGILHISADCTDLAEHPVMQAVRNFANHAWIGYVIMCLVVLLLAVALFVVPHAARKLFYRLASVRFLSRVKGSLQHLGDEIEITAHEYNHMPVSFWLRMGVATLINWTARYLLVNALLFAFSSGGLDMLQVYTRQYVLWIFLIIPPTPGASGWAEISFIALNCEFMPVGLSAAITLVWRMYSYYLYLLLGMIVLPKWAAGAAKNQ